MKKRTKKIQTKLILPNKRDRIEKLVNLFSAIYIDENNWLSKREKEFFIECVMLHYQGIEIHSSEAIHTLSEVSNFKLKNKGAYIYRNRLIKKQWLIRTTTGIEIAPLFLKNFDYIVVNLVIEDGDN